MTTTIKSLLKAEQRLTSYINILETHKAELPAGALAHLRDAENEMMNKRAKLEKDNGR